MAASAVGSLTSGATPRVGCPVLPASMCSHAPNTTPGPRPPTHAPHPPPPARFPSRSSTPDERGFVALVGDFGLARPLDLRTSISTGTYGARCTQSKLLSGRRAFEVQKGERSDTACRGASWPLACLGG